MTSKGRSESLYPEVEDQLRPLALPLGQPKPGDWLAEHREKGQSFRQYLAANPVRRSHELTTIYLCLIGEFDEAQTRVLDCAAEYLGLFFDVSVRVHRQIPLSAIPARARRKHPQWNDKQLLTPYLLQELLEPDRPDDALAYVALTARDLWPGHGWNFVFGEANLRRRVAACSIYRNGYPGKNEAAFRVCVRRTLMIATHETGHILTMQHCTAFRCLMNGCNTQEERDRTPLHLCPVCLRKLCWNLQVEPVPYLRRLEQFCRMNELDDAGDWYAQATPLLKKGAQEASVN